MDTFQNLFSSHNKVPLSGILDFTPLTLRQKQHLTRVYILLASSVFITTLGVQIATYVFALPTFLSFLGQLGCIIYIGITGSRIRYEPYQRKDQLEIKRLAAFLALAFFSGMSLAPFLHYANYIHPSIIPTAFCSTLAVFTCFSLAAMFSKDRKFLYLGGLISSLMGYLSMVSLFNLFFRSQLAHDIVLYGGLIGYMGFVLYDTQAILFEINQGVEDPVMHALAFYGDIIGIFIKLVQVLIQKETRRQEEEDRQQRNRRR